MTKTTWKEEFVWLTVPEASKPTVVGSMTSRQQGQKLRAPILNHKQEAERENLKGREFLLKPQSLSLVTYFLQPGHIYYASPNKATNKRPSIPMPEIMRDISFKAPQPDL